MLLLCIFFAGFILVRNSSAKIDPRRNPAAHVWDESTGTIPHSDIPVGASDCAINRTNDRSNGDICSMSVRSNRVNSEIDEWLDFLFRKIEGINKR
jgi:hypothetical protein